MAFDPSTATPTDVDDLVGAITHVESGGNTEALSSQGASGSMQITRGTFGQYAQPGESFNNDTDRRAAAIRKLNADYSHFGGDVSKTAAAYIGGRGAIRADGSIRDDVSDALGTTPAAYAQMVQARIGKNSTARSGFDPSTAQPVDDASQATSFDPSTAQPVEGKGLLARALDGASDLAGEIYGGIKSDVSNLFASKSRSVTDNLPQTDSPNPLPMPTIKVEPTTLASLAKATGMGLETSSAGIVLATNLALGQAPAAMIDAIHGAISGKTETSAQLYAKNNYVDPAIAGQKFFELSPEQRANPVLSMSFAISSALGALPSMLATSGAAGAPEATTAATTTWQMMENSVTHGAKVMAPTAYVDGVNHARELISQGVPFGQAVAAGATNALTTVMTGGLPISSEGAALMRVFTGVPLGIAQGELHREISNAALPSDRPDLQAPLTAEGVLQSGVTGGLMGATLGSRATPGLKAPAKVEPTFSPETATEVPPMQQAAVDQPAATQSSPADLMRSMRPIADLQAVKDDVVTQTAVSDPTAEATSVMTAADPVAAANAIVDAPMPEIAPEGPSATDVAAQHFAAIKDATDAANQRNLVDLPDGTSAKELTRADLPPDGPRKDALTRGMSDVFAAHDDLLGTKTTIVDHLPDSSDGMTTGADGHILIAADAKISPIDVFNHEVSHVVDAVLGGDSAAIRARDDAVRATLNDDSKSRYVLYYNDPRVQDQINQILTPAQVAERQASGSRNLDLSPDQTQQLAAIFDSPEINHTQELAADLRAHAMTDSGYWSAFRSALVDNVGDDRAASIFSRLATGFKAMLDHYQSMYDERPSFAVREMVKNHSEIYDAIAKADAEFVAKRTEAPDEQAPEVQEAAQDEGEPKLTAAEKRQALLDSLPKMTSRELRDVAENHPRVYMKKQAASILQDRADSASANRTAAAKRLSIRSKVVDPEVDTMASAIAKLQGINRESAAARMQFSPEELNARAMVGNFSKFIFHKYGMPMDRMGAALAELGYVQSDQYGKHDQSDFEDKLADSANGIDVYTPNAIMRRAQEAHEHAMAEVGARSEGEYDKAEHNVEHADNAMQRNVDAAFDAPSREGYLENEQIDRLFEQADGGLPEKYPGGAEDVRGLGIETPSEGSGEQRYELSGESHSESEARLKAEQARYDAEAAEDREYEQRAAADAERDRFSLTGSNRDADTAAAAGQDPLFSRERDAAVNAVAKFDSFDAKVREDAKRGIEPNADEYFNLSHAVAKTETDLAEKLAQTPDNDFSLRAETSDGRMLALNQSAQKPGHWQLTRFGKDGAPWGDTQYPTKMQAIKDFLHESSLSTVKDFSKTLFSREREQTNTPEFKKWFGDSKAVDAQGNPLLMYHGTRGDFNIFDHNKIGSQGRSEGAGFYFTSSDAVASGYGKPMAVYLSIKNPLPYDAKPFSKAVVSKIVKRIAGIEAKANGAKIGDGFLSNYGDVSYQGLDAVVREAANLISKDGTALDQLSGIVGSGVNPEYVNRATQEVTGHDGVIAQGFSNSGDAENKIYVAFFPEQIKSATGNNGKFDATNPDIRYSREREQTNTPEFKKWFGDWSDPKAHSSRAKGPVSYAVDGSGRPLMLYHATNRDFSEFKTGLKSTTSTTFGDMDTVRHGIFTTPDVNFSETYLKAADGKNVMPLFMNIKSPLDMRGGIRGDQISDIVENANGAINRNDFRGIKSSETWQFFDDNFGENFVSAAKRAGYDGAIINEYSPTTDKTHDVYVAFDPEQIKSAAGNSGAFDSANPDIRYSRERESTWHYSQLSRSIEQAPDKVFGAPKQVRAWLESNASKLGIKKDELQWSGVTDWLALQGGKVNKQDVMDYLRSGGVQVTETVKNAGGRELKFNETSPGQWDAGNSMRIEKVTPDNIRQIRNGSGHENANVGDYATFTAGGSYLLADNFNDAKMYLNEAHQEGGGKTLGETKYDSYQLPGGTNYRELLLTLPAKEVKANPLTQLPEGYEVSFDRMQPEGRQFAVIPPGQEHGRPYGGVRAATAEDARSAALSVLNSERDNDARDAQSKTEYKSSHWDEPNILAHIRFNDRTDADGKRVLFIEELQSDWGQAGLKGGFQRPMSDATHEIVPAKISSRSAEPDGYAIYRRGEDDGAAVGMFKTKAEAETEIANGALESKSAGKIPTAPFVTKTEGWLQLGIKRMISYAAENGYDKMAFVNGEQSAGRYDLSKSLDSIDVRKLDTGKLVVYANKDNQQIFQKIATAETLPEIIGKELSERVTKDIEAGRPTQYQGLDLKVGGEGMKAFYDKIVPQNVNDVLKKLGGGKVTPTLIPMDGFKGYVDYEVGAGAVRGTAVVGIKANGERVTLDQNGDSAAKVAQLKADLAGVTQPGFDITPEMKAKAADGLPLFSRARDASENDKAAPVSMPVPEIKSLLSRVLQVPREFLKSPIDRISTAVIPMSTGSDAAKVVATRFADQNRWSRHQWNKFDEVITKEFTPEQQEKMWNAADQENDLRRDGITDPNRGLNTLDPKERDVVELLHAYGEELLKRARDNGMFEGEGVPFWTPRMVMLIDGDGRLHLPPPTSKGEGSNDARNLRTSASSLKQRKYLTSAETEAAAQGMNEGDKTATIVRNIRTMPMAMARLEQAVAGRELVNQVKAIGQSTGIETVSANKQGNKDFFTMDHPALRLTRPEMIDDPETGKIRARLDENGDPVMQRQPLYISKDFEGPMRAVLNRESLPGYQAVMSIKSKSLGLIMMSPAIHLAVEYGRSAPAMLTSVSPGTAAKNLATLGVYTFVVGHSAKQDMAQMRFAIEHGLVPIGGRGQNVDINGIADAASLEVGKSWTSKALGYAVDLINKDAGQATRKGADAFGKFFHETLLWNRIADLQMGLFSTMHTSLINKGVDESTAGTMAAHWANRYAGALPAEAMGQYAREVANVVMFSRSFTLGNLGLMKDMVNGLPPNRQAVVRLAAIEAARAEGKTEADASEQGSSALGAAKKIARSKAIQTVVLDIALSYIANAFLQDWIHRMRGDESWGDQVAAYKERLGAVADKLHDDPLAVLSHPWDAVESLTPQGHNPEGKRNRVRYGDDKEGNSIYIRLPFGKVGEELQAYTTPASAAKTLGGKLSPMVSAGFQSFNGVDHFGRKIYDDHDTAMVQVLKATGHFLVAQTPWDQIVATKDVASGNGDEMDYYKAFGPFSGLTYSKVTGGDVLAEEYKAARDFQDRKIMSMPDVKSAIKAGDYDKANDILESIGMSPHEASQMISRLENPDKQMSSQSFRKIYRHATEDQKKSIDELRAR